MRILTFIILAALAPLAASAQTAGVKTNLLYLGTGTPNLGVEIGLGKKTTLGFAGGYNVLNLEKTKETDPSLVHWSASAQLRYWFCRKFYGTFLGVEGIYGDYEIEDVPLLDLPKKYRYDGTGYGGGIVVGNHWALGKRWGLEMSAGAGVLFLEYDKIRQGGGENKGKFKQTYVGPTKLNISFIYLF